MDLGLKDRVALITGAAGGIGLATARLLAEEGVKLVLTDREQDALQQSTARLAGDPLLIAADMTRQAEVDDLVRQAEIGRAHV